MLQCVGEGSHLWNASELNCCWEGHCSSFTWRIYLVFKTCLFCILSVFGSFVTCQKIRLKKYISLWLRARVVLINVIMLQYGRKYQFCLDNTKCQFWIRTLIHFHRSVCTILGLSKRICYLPDNCIICPFSFSGLHGSLQDLFSCLPRLSVDCVLHVLPLQVVKGWERSGDLAGQPSWPKGVRSVQLYCLPEVGVILNTLQYLGTSERK